MPLQLPVADSVADSKQTSSVADSDSKQTIEVQRLPIKFRNRQFQRISNLQLVADSVADSKQTAQRIGNWQLVAGCRFRFKTDNISLTNRQLATSCRLPLQLRFETDNFNESPIADSDSKQTLQFQRIGHRQLSCRLPIQLPIRN